MAYSSSNPSVFHGKKGVNMMHTILVKVEKKAKMAHNNIITSSIALMQLALRT